ncbi:hypothetical protein E8L90_19665 [Brevibacillus antibioticus]|uniref:Phr family secreted Rap phosphatase inhibitor n=1 Tax=Brevibacillus antibioticus TaxID=2570228 RepID=A0A4V5TJ11_9BACL|nr:hypothetical protein [Brevibacillus antibioticus]TKI57493.1 hypothetical protein E8L90_19665 [Brevibacillus antibioticus]
MKKKASFLLVALSMALGSFLAIDIPYKNSNNDSLLAVDVSYGINKEKSNSPQRVPDPGY